MANKTSLTLLLILVLNASSLTGCSQGDANGGIVFRYAEDNSVQEPFNKEKNTVIKESKDANNNVVWTSNNEVIAFRAVDIDEVESTEPTNQIPGMFSLSDEANSDMFKQAKTVEDYGFDPSKTKLLKITKDDYNAYIIDENTNGLASSFKITDKSIGTINPSKAFSNKYLDNPFNVLLRIPGLGEGNATILMAYILNSRAFGHGDPGNSKTNIGLPSGQYSEKTGAHDIWNQIYSQTGSLAETRKQIFTKGTYADVGAEYTQSIKQSFIDHKLWDKNQSTAFFVVMVDTITQFGGAEGEIKSGKSKGQLQAVTLFVKYYKEIEKSDKPTLIKWLDDNGYGTKFEVSGNKYDVNKYSVEFLRLFVARLKIYHGRPNRFNGIAKIASENYGKSYAYTSAYNVAQRFSQIQDVISLQGLQHLAEAPVSAFPVNSKLKIK
jgi:hypothetical protein